VDFLFGIVEYFGSILLLGVLLEIGSYGWYCLTGAIVRYVSSHLLVQIPREQAALVLGTLAAVLPAEEEEDADLHDVLLFLYIQSPRRWRSIATPDGYRPPPFSPPAASLLPLRAGSPAASRRDDGWLGGGAVAR
jgi:hypothetical protein